MRLTNLERTFRHNLRAFLTYIRGNKIALDGCEIDVSSDLVPKRIISRLYNGTYEEPERIILNNHFSFENPTVELGAGMGVLSCITNSKLAKPNNHVVVEANPNLIPVIKDNRSINNAKFDVFHSALSYDRNQIPFNLHEEFESSSLFRETESSVQVPTTTLSEIIDEKSFQTINLIADIEGSEKNLFDNEMDTIQEKVAFLLLEFHPSVLGEDTVHTYLNELRERGFVEQASKEFIYCFKNKTF